jgi:pimeloyl-ACP methyl ester carboxylesterase
MWPLHECLEAYGFDVRYWGYPSLGQRLEELGQRFGAELQRVDEEPTVARIHIVGHSLGGIIAREALCRRMPAKMGRMVMLAPPNRGSAAARKTARFWGGLFPVLRELSDEPAAAVRVLPGTGDVEVGIIAATEDKRVRPEDTHLPGEADHISLPGSHGLIMLRADTCHQTAYFLRHGQFERPCAAAVAGRGSPQR